MKSVTNVQILSEEPSIQTILSLLWFVLSNVVLNNSRRSFIPFNISSDLASSLIVHSGEIRYLEIMGFEKILRISLITINFEKLLNNHLKTSVSTSAHNGSDLAYLINKFHLN